MINRADVAESLRVAVLHLSRGLRGSEKLGESRYSVLAALAGGPMTVTALASHERVSVPSMSKLVSSMTETGLVQRARDVNDARRVEVSMTDMGRQALAVAFEGGMAWLDQHFEGLEEEDIITLSRAAAIMRGMVTR